MGQVLEMAKHMSSDQVNGYLAHTIKILSPLRAWPGKIQVYTEKAMKAQKWQNGQNDMSKKKKTFIDAVD